MFRNMVQIYGWVLPVLILLFAASDLYGQKGSKPTFRQYETQEMITPLPKSTVRLEHRDIVMAGFSIILLASSTVASVWLRSRRMLVVNAILAVSIPGFYFAGCPCPVGAIQNITLALACNDYCLPVSILVLFLAPLFVTLLFGRTFCGSACPIGAVQELIALRPVTIPNWFEDAFGLLRYIVLGLAVLFASSGLTFIICRYDPVVCLFRGGTGWVETLLFAAGILLIGIVVARPYCRFLCPYGAILSLCGKLAIRHVTVSPGNCTGCRLCEQMCPYNAILPPSRELSRDERKRGLTLFVISLIALPLLLACGTLLGSCLAFPLAQLHPVVRQAELVRAEETGLVDRFGAFDETTAHYRAGIDNEVLYRRAAGVMLRFRRLCPIFGLWCGLVFGGGLIALCARKKRTEYEADPGRCFSCGRCFWYCPNQKAKRFYLREDEVGQTESRP